MFRCAGTLLAQVDLRGALRRSSARDLDAQDGTQVEPTIPNPKGRFLWI